MKKSESGNYTVYEGSDPNSLHDYSQTIAKELENRDRQFEEEQGNQNTNIELLQKENEEIKEENSRLKEDLNCISDNERKWRICNIRYSRQQV